MTEQIKVGSRAHWTDVSRSRGALSMRRKEAVVTSIDADGWARLKTDRGGVKWVMIARLRLIGQPSQIAEFIEAVQL